MKYKQSRTVCKENDCTVVSFFPLRGCFLCQQLNLSSFLEVFVIATCSFFFTLPIFLTLIFSYLLFPLFFILHDTLIVIHHM